MAKKPKVSPINPDFTVEWWDVDRPSDYPLNARKWSAAAVEKVAASIKAFGWRQPIVVDIEGCIVIGHLRRAAARHAGLKQVPVHVAADLTPEAIRGLRLADNRTHDEAEWDLELLSKEFGELKALDYDLAPTGFNQFELDWHGAPNGAGVDSPEWSGMPEFEQPDRMPWRTVYVHFADQAALDKFAEATGCKVGESAKFVWYPHRAREQHSHLNWTSASASPRYPVYIISKGRWEKRLTAKALDAINVPYHIVVEPQEYEQYAAVIDPQKILTLPFSNLGQGSIPARNWVWEHSMQGGAARHWILDDNIRDFERLHQNVKHKVASGSIFAAAEDFTDRFQNVALSGFQYRSMAKQNQELEPFIKNTRVYSCILIDNSLPFRWRGRYNEDTDLSLRCLKASLCTVLFNAFLAFKETTMTMKGGNTDELYQGDGRKLMAESLMAQHPDVVTITEKFGRWQHQVDYRPFRANKFIPQPEFEAPKEPNEYGMELTAI